jgi:hypothetical protein
MSTAAPNDPSPPLERRRHARFDADAAATCTLRLRGGEALRLLNLSPTGALVESTRRLLPGHRYALHWASGPVVQTVRGEVVRARVGRLRGEASLAYEVALVFDETLLDAGPPVVT